MRILIAICVIGIASNLGACGGGGGDPTSPAGPPVPQPPAAIPPAIASFTPAAAAVGAEVRISGLNFAGTPSGNTVRFNGANATVSSASALEIVALVPAGATSGPIQVSTSGGNSFSSASFTVLAGSTPGASWQTRTLGPHIELPSGAITHNGTRFVSVGSSAYEASLDPRLWTRTRTLVSAQDVAWNGQLFVAVGNSSFVDTSPDGLTWTMRALPSGNPSDLTDVVASPAIWVAVGEDGVIFSSPDAITWTARVSGTSKDLTDVTWTGSRFVAVGADGAVVTSPDGTTWTLQAPPTTDSFTAVGASPALIVASTFPYAGSQLRVLTSSDGVTWNTLPLEFGGFRQIIYAGGRFVGVAGNRSWVSIDGVVWNSSAAMPVQIDSLVYVNDQYVGVGIDGNSVRAVVTSPDALTWTIIQSAHALRRVVQSPVDGRLVAAAQNSHIARTSTDNGTTWSFAPLSPVTSDNYPFIDLAWSRSTGAFVAHVQIAANQYAYTSTDGAAWTQRGYMPCYGALAASPTRMVNVGSSLVGACVAVSTDAANWTTVTAPSGTLMRGVFWSGSQFVGVGDAGLIATSPDGMSWTVRTSGVNASLNSGVGSGTTLVVFGSGGTIVTSNDGGVSWVSRSSGVSATLRHGVFTGSEFFIVGGGGTLLRSASGASWSKQPVPFDEDLGDVVWLAAPSRLVLAGSSGLTATSP